MTGFPGASFGQLFPRGSRLSGIRPLGDTPGDTPFARQDLSKRQRRGQGDRMPSFISNPPDAAALMMSARSFGSYDLAAALADLIDNSIAAMATRIDLLCEFNEGAPEIRVVDDGYGMSAATLSNAMRPASANPLVERSPDDLGRFGWGMKSASFSQCRKLTVLSSRDGEICGAAWNLLDVDDWKMAILSREEAITLSSGGIRQRSGTEVIWTDCDRLSEDGQLDRDTFNATVATARNRLALTFHRFLQGEVPRRPLRIFVNGTQLVPNDPYMRDHAATQVLERESLMVDGQPVTIQPHVLPHFSKLNSGEQERIAGEEGTARNQGFYLYRGNRLIIHGTWFRLIRHSELTQIIRVSVDIPNALDRLWRITIDKSDAQLPAPLRKRFRQLITGFRRRSSRVHRRKGGELGPQAPEAMWHRHGVDGTVRYRINRSHPLVTTLKENCEADERATLAALLAAIEHSFPVAAFSTDIRAGEESIHQTIGDAAEFRDMLRAAVPGLLANVGGDVAELKECLRNTEPFMQNWKVVEEFLLALGLRDA